MARGTRIRVLAVIPGESAGASMIFARRLNASLPSDRIECREFYLESRTEISGVIGGWRALRKEIQSFRPDLLHAHYGTVTGLVTVLSTSLPVVVHLRGSDLLTGHDTLRTRLAHLMSQLSVLRAERIICVAPHLVQAMWWRRGRAAVIPTGIDLEEFQPGDRKAARRSLDWPAEGPVVIFNASRDPAIKRLDLARAAVESARAEVPSIRLEVLDGHQDPHSIATMFQAADCLLLTSAYEGSPNVVKEAMACNLPVVAVDVGDVRSRLADTRPSTITEPDPARLAAAVVDILQQDGIRSNGREGVQDLRQEATVAKVVAVYEEALS